MADDSEKERTHRLRRCRSGLKPRKRSDQKGNKFASMAAVVKSAARARQNQKTVENRGRGRMEKPRLNPPASAPKPRVFQRNPNYKYDPIAYDIILNVLHAPAEHRLH